MARCDQIGPYVRGESPHGDFGHAQAACSESLGHDSVIPTWRASQNPRLINQLGEIDLAAMGPLALQTSGNDQFVVKKDFHLQIIEGVVVRGRKAPYELHDEVE